MLRKIAAICLLTALLLGAARAESLLCINAPGMATLTDMAGVERIECGRFDEIFTVREGELYAAGSRGAYRLLNARGEALGDVTFSMIHDEGGSLIFRGGALYGAMDSTGEILLPARWTQLTADGAGGWLALDDDPLDEQPDELIHIGADGAQRRTGVETASGLTSMSGGRMPFVDGDGLWGAVNGDGAVVIAPAWSYMGAFAGGAAKVAGTGGMGLIDAGGRIVVAARYVWLERSSSMTAAWDGDGIDVYPPGGGQRRFHLPGPIREAALVGNALAVTYEGGVSLYDSTGKLLARGKPGTIFSPGNQGRFIASDGEWGEKCQWLVNSGGSTASPRFQQLLPLRGDRYAFMEMEGIEYYSQELGRLQKSWDYADRLYGLVDGTGRVLLPAEYLEIRALADNRLLLVDYDEISLADRDGRVIRAWVNPESEVSIDEAGE